jgi:hypothetical protein
MPGWKVKVGWWLVTSVNAFADVNLVAAIRAVDDMVNAPDSDRKMLYLAMQLPSV